ncbi:hypothetical protein [Catellatospora methionotrophica]|uniref:hypothetical protein n=1 Tax=Catellatospora methionotrophica TaxID=121620 RepID=UPI0033E18F52
MHESVRRIDALAADTASLRVTIDRAEPTASWPEAPGRMARLAGAIAEWQRTSRSGHLDTARRCGDEFEELARGVRAAEGGYHIVDDGKGMATWTP